MTARISTMRLPNHDGIAVGGIGAMHALARRIGLIDAIDREPRLVEDPPSLS